ncbi:MAG: ABC transporter ATP-binding protein [Steroidobacteraceae bacterium]
MSPDLQATELSCTALDIAVQECVLVAQLNLQLQPGTLTAVLGRNGTGKSLTLHTLAGLRPAKTGQVQLGARELQHYPRRELAQHLSFVPQDIDEPFPVTVLECALSGRHPHIDFWQWETAQDYAIARTALAAVDLQHFEQRNVETLSGGERRRLAIATALAQQPQVFILDEPTNHLDPQHQLQVLKLLRDKADAGAAVIMSLHDPNLAARFADQALLLFGDGRWLHGNSSDIIGADTLSQLYKTTMQEFTALQGRYFVSA